MDFLGKTCLGEGFTQWNKGVENISRAWFDLERSPTVIYIKLERMSGKQKVKNRQVVSILWKMCVRVLKWMSVLKPKQEMKLKYKVGSKRH